MDLDMDVAEGGKVKVNVNSIPSKEEALKRAETSLKDLIADVSALTIIHYYTCMHTYIMVYSILIYNIIITYNILDITLV